MKSKKIAAAFVAIAVLASPFLASADTSSSIDIFFSKSFSVSDLVDGKVLQQNPYVVVSSVSGGAVAANDPYVLVNEYAGKENDPVSGEVTYWKSEKVNIKNGNVIGVYGGLSGYPIEVYPELKPPMDSSIGYDFGNQQPANPVWATGSSTNPTPIPNWNPLVKGTNSSGFNDVPYSNENAPYITDLHKKGLIDGTGNGNFSPDSPLTREQFAKMAVEAFGVPMTTSQMPFTDVTDTWAKPYVAAVYAVGITKGTGATTFDGTAPLTKEQAAAMVWRWISSHGVQAASDASTYDVSDADGWAKGAVENVMALGLRADGKSHASYQSKNVMNRGDAAALIDLSMKQMKGN